MEHRLAYLAEQVRALAEQARPEEGGCPPDPEPPPCPECRYQGVIGYDVPPGHPLFGRVERCPHPSHQVARLDRLAALSGLQAGDLSRRLSDLQPNDGNRAMLRAAGSMLARPYGWLYIWGPPGNGKTETLIGLVNGFNAESQGPAMYVTFSRLLDWMRQAFEQNLKAGRAGDFREDRLAAGSYSARFHAALAVKVLAIDELDKARATEFAAEFRTHFLDERYRQAIHGQSVTIFAGNESPEFLPAPLYDRIRDGRFRIVHNRAPSVRPALRPGETQLTLPGDPVPGENGADCGTY